MPIPTTAKWPKPRSEDEFEDMCVDFLRIRWKDPHAARNGRRGQRQDGVDIVGHPSWLKGKTAGAQCKNTDGLKLGDIVAEAKKAESFKSGLDEFLMVTSGERDAALQAEVREHFRSEPAPFHVEVVFWPDVVADISQDEGLVAKHWKGFGSPASSADGWPGVPAWIDREGVRDEETVECQLELAVRTPRFAEASASELAAEMQAVLRTGGSSAGGELAFTMNKPASRANGNFRWREHYREYDNVIRKWELEIGDHGFLAFRWSKFTTESNHPQPRLEMARVLDGAIAPIRLHRIAIERVSKRAGVSLPEQIAARLACCGSAPLLLNDDVQATEPGNRFSMPESAPRWTEDIEMKWAPSSRNLVVRLLNRALSNFTVSPGPAFLGGSAQLLTIKEDAVMKLGGADL